MVVSELPLTEKAGKYVEREPVLIAATLAGLAMVIAQLAEARESVAQSRHREEHLEHALQLSHMTKDMKDLLARVVRSNLHLSVVMGEDDVPGREIIGTPNGPALGGSTVFKAGSQHRIDYAEEFSVVNFPDLMPQPARYYPNHQLLVGNHDAGVLPFFKLYDIKKAGGEIGIPGTRPM